MRTGVEPVLLVKRLISWRNRVSHILLLSCWYVLVFPAVPQRQALGKMAMVPSLSALPWGELKRRHYAVLSAATRRYSWILDHLLPYQCDERSPWIANSQCF